MSLTGTHDALVVKLLTARGVPKAYMDVDTSKSKK
jgi:translation initiation factor 2D